VTTPLSPNDGDAWIRRLEQAHDEGRADFIQANMPALERLIARVQERLVEIARRQYRLRVVRHRGEPPANRPVRRS